MKSSPLFYAAVVCVAFAAVWLGFPQPELDMDTEIVPLALNRMGLAASTSTTAPLENFVVVVTGATSGIGLGLTISLTGLGATVVAIGRSSRKLAELERTVVPNKEGKVVPILADLTDLESVVKAADDIQDRFDHVDVLVNNAGMHYRGTTWHHPVTPQGIDLSFGVNYLSHFLLTEKMIPLLRNSTKPSIVQTSSSFHWAVDGSELLPGKDGSSPVASQKGAANLILWRDQRAYANSKLAQVLHMRSLQREYPDIQTVSVCPGWVSTNIAGTTGHPGFHIMSHLAFPLEGFGLKSMLQAILGTEHDGDMYYNTLFSDVFLHIPKLFFSPFMYRTGIRDTLSFIIASAMLLGQKFMPVSHTARSSPESYNVELQNSLYQWSKDTVAPFLQS